MIEGTCSLSFFMCGPLCRRYLLSLPLVSSTLSSRAVFAAVKSSRAVSTTARRMASEGGDGEPPKKNLSSHPGVAKMQELLTKDHAGGWDECWKEGKTPWDLGQSTPVILHLLQTGTLPKGRVLIPGCGTGYDVVAIADPERYVVGLDVSDNAVKKANELFALSPNANYFTFLAADFFTWRPTQLFDLVFDYTFFCAIEPQMRLAWASQMRNLLKLDGELITLIFPIDDHAGGPPYAVSLSDYEDVLSPLGFRATYVADNELAIGSRKGREKLARWKRFLTPQL